MKIDTTTIDGFDSMSADEKLKAILELDLPDTNELEKIIAKQKETINKTSAEAAENRRKLAAKMTEDEAAAEASKKEFEDMKAELEQFKRLNSISTRKASYLALGYSSDLAEKKATAIADGDYDTVDKIEKQYREELEKQIKADITKNSPRPDGDIGNPDGKKGDDTAVEFAKNLAATKKAANEASKAIYDKYIK